MRLFVTARPAIKFLVYWSAAAQYVLVLVVSLLSKMERHSSFSVSFIYDLVATISKVFASFYLNNKQSI